MDEAGGRQRKLDFHIYRNLHNNRMPGRACYVEDGRFAATMRSRAATVFVQGM